MATYTDQLQTVSDVLGILTKGEERMPALRARILLEIAISPGLSMADLEEKTGLHQSNISRNIATMCEWEKLGVPGTNLVAKVTDPAAANRMLVFLTAKGRKLIEAALARISGKSVTFESPTAQEHVRALHKQAGE